MDDKHKVVRGIEYYRALEADYESVKEQIVALMKSGSTAVDTNSAVIALDMRLKGIKKRASELGTVGTGGSLVEITIQPTNKPIKSWVFIGVTQELALRLLELRETSEYHVLKVVTAQTQE